ncbi:hypothetical protein L3Y34_016575 [Caenorhabditis briggsae]|uniref:K Homology domain-containing protein n=1 Tax=Caenorhabditis briggsae TaxID=6238 RepID=A0AAE9J1A3_CAEBR|nr:hypothetical protein L3Y34_016575 [Caenorhabditis briggsae]
MLHNYDVAADFGAKMQTGAPQAPRNTLLSVDQQLQLMNTINNMVRASQFTSQLANTIFTLCAQLKTSGSLLEQSHKNELNKVFTSLRQACCRDNGQLGTPCRLKIMELVELRAMNWRTNLAHSQYYVNRPEGQHDPAPTVGIPPSSATSQSAQMTSSVTSPVPQSPQPPMQFVPPNPMMFQDPMGGGPNPGGIFFIPAASTWMNPLMPMPPNPFLPHSMLPPDHQMFLRQRSLNNKKPNLMNKTLQLRHEMIIRNSDSGKIMGVKGRRVAAVEQLTNTVISFQKVDAKSKERTLTITASTMEDIERAKDMIIDTIRRNMSPIRNDMSMPPPMPIADLHQPSNPQGKSPEDDEDEDDEDIKLEQTSDGKLTFHCDDPELLAAAQEALSAYLRVRARPSAEEREKKKERRKSMPLQQTAHHQQEPVMLKPSKTFHGSTPNLADGLAATTTVVMATAVPASHVQQQQPQQVQAVGEPIRYNRDSLMTARETMRAPMAPEMLKEITRVAPDILIA